MYLDNPMMYLGEVWKKLLYGKQPAGRDTLGPKKNILSISRNDLKKYMDSQYTAKNTIVCISGKIEENDILEKVKKQFKGIAKNNSFDKEKVIELAEKGLVVEKPKDAIKDPYILEFIGLPEKSIYSENELEQKLIDKLEYFLLELGTGFTFVARQKRISFDDKHFRIDLVFYNRILKCFVLIDLKIGELKHQDIGQMQMYVNYYDREIKLLEENRTIGIILCQNKSEAVVQYTLPENNEQIFASKYQTVLPSKEDLKKLIESKD